MIELPNPEEHIKSIIKDLDSYDVIKQRGWLKHIPLGVLFYTITLFILTFTFSGVPLLVDLFISNFVYFIGVKVFEALQTKGRIIEAPERFESEKDAIMSIPLFVLIILVLKLLKVFR